MKRHPALHDLSRDHHTVLIHCQRLRRATERNPDPAQWLEHARTMASYFEHDLDPHFEEEDRFVVHAAESRNAPTLATLARRVRDDHAWLRQRFLRLKASLDAPEAASGLLREIAPRLDRHVRFEEGEFYEALQTAMTDAELRALWKESHAFRSMHRSPEACSVQPPPHP